MKIYKLMSAAELSEELELVLKKEPKNVEEFNEITKEISRRNEKRIKYEARKEFIYFDEKGKEKISIPNVTNYLLNQFSFKTIFGIKDEKIYIYENGIYILRGKEKIKTQVEELLQSKCTINIVNEIIEKIKRKTAISEEEFDEVPIKFICLRNGIFDINKKELIPHHPIYYFKTKININYDPNMKSEKIINFIEEICYPDNIPVIQEWFGFCLYRRYFIKKAIILFGEKDTGKTVLLNILTKFIGGNRNISGISLQRIASKDKFSIKFLKDKLINIYDDLSSDDLKDSGGFKIAVGGGFATGEHKFGDSFQFLNYAKNIFATNMIPSVKDINDDAYYDRWIPLPFDNQIEKNNQDNFLFERITTKEELSGLLNWALEGLYRLLKNGKFSYNKSNEEIKRIMQRQNNPLIAFIDENLEQQDGNKITKEIMFKIYSKWCQEKKVPRMSKEQLGRNLAKNTNYIIAKRDKERFWENVKFKGDVDTIDTIF